MPASRSCWYGPKDGPVYALEDRCAHRQVPLSKGTVEGQSVRCCYHGWAYGRSGACVDVPYLGKDKLPNGVRSYPCQEVGGLIMVFPGDASLAATTPVPAFGASADPAYKTRRFGRVVGCHYSFMHENLMDMNHQFMHAKQMGQMKPRFLGQDRGEDWIEARYSFARTGGKQPLGEALIFGERRGTEKKHADRDVMTIRTEYPYQTLRIRTKDEAPVMDLWIAYTPQDEAQRSNRTFGLLSVRKPKIPGPPAGGLAAAGPVHRTDLPRGPRHRRDGAGGARCPGRGPQPGGIPGDTQPARPAGIARHRSRSGSRTGLPGHGDRARVIDGDVASPARGNGARASTGGRHRPTPDRRRRSAPRASPCGRRVPTMPRRSTGLSMTGAWCACCHACRFPIRVG